MTRFSFTIYNNICQQQNTLQWLQGRPWRGRLPCIYIYICNIYMYVHFRTVSIILTPMFSRIFTFVLFNTGTTIWVKSLNFWCSIHSIGQSLNIWWLKPLKPLWKPGFPHFSWSPAWWWTLVWFADLYVYRRVWISHHFPYEVDQKQGKNPIDISWYGPADIPWYPTTF